MVSELTKQIVLKEFSETTEAERFWLLAEMDEWELETLDAFRKNYKLRHKDYIKSNIECLKYVLVLNSTTQKLRHKITDYADYTSDLNAIFRVLSKLGQADLKLGGEIWLCRFISYLELPMATASTFWTIKEMLKKAEKPQQLFTALAETIAAMRRKELKLEKTDEHN